LLSPPTVRRFPEIFPPRTPVAGFSSAIPAAYEPSFFFFPEEICEPLQTLEVTLGWTRMSAANSEFRAFPSKRHPARILSLGASWENWNFCAPGGLFFVFFAQNSW